MQLSQRIQRHERHFFARLKHWVDCDIPEASLAALKLALLYGYGKPPEKLIISGDERRPLVVAMPGAIGSQAQWDQLVRESICDVEPTSVE